MHRRAGGLFAVGRGGLWGAPGGGCNGGVCPWLGIPPFIVSSPAISAAAGLRNLPNGAEMAQLDERFQEFEVVRIGPNGKLVRTCVQGPAAAEKAWQAKPAPAKELQ